MSEQREKAQKAADQLQARYDKLAEARKAAEAEGLPSEALVGYGEKLSAIRNELDAAKENLSEIIASEELAKDQAATEKKDAMAEAYNKHKAEGTLFDLDPDYRDDLRRAHLRKVQAEGEAKLYAER